MTKAKGRFYTCAVCAVIEWLACSTAPASITTNTPLTATSYWQPDFTIAKLNEEEFKTYAPGVGLVQDADLLLKEYGFNKK